MAAPRLWPTAAARLVQLGHPTRLASSTSSLSSLRLQARSSSTSSSASQSPSGFTVRSNAKPHKGTPTPVTKSTGAPGQSPAVEQHASTSQDSLLEPLPSAAAAAEPVPAANDNGTTELDWSTSFHGLSVQPFPSEAANILMQPIDPNDVEIKPGKPVLHVSPERLYVFPS
jgi:hypothetical protein